MTNKEAAEFIWDVLDGVKSFNEEGGKGLEALDLAIKALKTERPQGEWNEIQAGMFACPFCGARPHKDFKNFCAKCGADMRGNKNGDDE